MFNIGTQELVVILLVVLLLFGAKRIPEVSRALGKGLGDFRDALSGVERELRGEEGPPPRRTPAWPPPVTRPNPLDPRLPPVGPGGQAGPAVAPGTRDPNAPGAPREPDPDAPQGPTQHNSAGPAALTPERSDAPPATQAPQATRNEGDSSVPATAKDPAKGPAPDPGLPGGPSR